MSSDDEKHKLKYKDFINQCHDKADDHSKYCSMNCVKNINFQWYPHDSKCIQMIKDHFDSFVYCDSLLCLKTNDLERVRPSYYKEKPKEEVITQSTYYDEDV